MTEFAVVVAGSTLAAGLAAAFALRLLPTVRQQLAALALVAVALPLVAVTLGGLVMFHMHDDVKLLEVGAASASTSLVAALLLGNSIARRVRTLEQAAAHLAAGELKARAQSDGPREVARLGASFNEMATSIEQLFDARRQLVAWASHDLRSDDVVSGADEEDGLARHGREVDRLGEGDRDPGLDVEAVERVQHSDVRAIRRCVPQSGFGRSTCRPVFCDGSATV